MNSLSKGIIFTFLLSGLLAAQEPPRPVETRQDKPLVAPVEPVPDVGFPAPVEDNTLLDRPREDDLSTTEDVAAPDEPTIRDGLPDMPVAPTPFPEPDASKDW